MTTDQFNWVPGKPYNHLPTLPPSHDLESKTILKRCIAARAALAELKQAAELIPNQAMLINTIPLLEAKDSSEIENIVTTTDKLFQHSQAESQADSATMPDNLRHAHDRNDELLEGIYIGRRFKNDTERLEKLFALYTKMTATPAAPATPAKKIRRSKQA